jgi:hypothetical protein
VEWNEMNEEQPIRYSIPIVRLEIRVMRDLSGGDDWATLIALDEKGNEHTFGYTDNEGIDHRVYVESPKDGKLKGNPKYK